MIVLENGTIVKRHINQIRKTERARVNRESDFDESEPPDKEVTIPKIQEARRPINSPEP